MQFAQQWTKDGTRTWYEGLIQSFVVDTLEFELLYEGEESSTFMTTPELLADVISGDLELNY